MKRRKCLFPFDRYKNLFSQTYKELKEGKRIVVKFNKAGKNLLAGNFYFIGSKMIFIERANILPEEDKKVFVIYEDGTYSDLLYHSLSNRIRIDGKMIVWA